MKRVALYSRVSTLEQKNKGYSLEAQKERLTQYSKAMNFTIIDHYSDGGSSGSNLNRPEIQRLINDIESNKIDIVLVHKLDRLSRSQKNTLYLIEDVFLKHEVGFISLQENIDTTTAFGRAMIGILSVFAQLELDTITERLMMGRVERAKKGLWKGSGNVPFGYDYTDGKLIKNEDHVIVQEIFERFTDGESAYEIYKNLVLRYPNRIYGNNMITRILDNKIYTGTVIFDEEHYDGKHERIISEDLFEIAESKRNESSDKYKVDKTKRAALLARKLYCGKCGNNMSMFRHYTKKGDRTNYAYYRCNTKRNRTKRDRQLECDQENFRTDLINEKVLESLSVTNIEEAKQKIERKRKQVPATKRLDELNKQQKRLIDLYQLGSMDITDLDSRIKKIEKEKNQLNESKRSIKDRKTIAVLETLENSNIFEMDFDEQCEMIDSLVYKVVLKGEKIDVRLDF